MPPGLQIHLFLLLHNWASTIWKHRCNHQGASLIRRYDLKEYHPWGWKRAWQCELYLRSMWKKGLVVCNSSSCYSSLWAGNSFCENSQFSSVAQLCLTLCDPMNHSTPGLPVHHQLPEFTQTQVHWVSDAFQPSHPLSSPSPPAPNPSQHQSLFQWVSSSREGAKVLEFQLCIIPSKEIPGLISFRMDWLDLLAVQGTLKSLLQHHSSKASRGYCYISKKDIIPGL